MKPWNNCIWEDLRITDTRADLKAKIQNDVQELIWSKLENLRVSSCRWGHYFGGSCRWVCELQIHSVVYRDSWAFCPWVFWYYMLILLTKILYTWCIKECVTNRMPFDEVTICYPILRYWFGIFPFGDSGWTNRSPSRFQISLLRNACRKSENRRYSIRFYGYSDHLKPRYFEHL